MKSYILPFLICLPFLLFFSCKKDTPWEENSIKGITIEGTSAIITKDTEWKDLYGGDTIDYYVKSLVKVQGTAILTIKPGVKISFETAESGIRVEENAGMNASGSASKLIEFTSKTESKSAWKGIIFASNNTSNKLDYVKVLYAGSAKDEGYCDKPTAIGLAKNKNARASISNTTIEESGGNGLWVAGTFDVVLNFQKNIISACNDAPVALTADNMSKLDSLSNYNYSANNYIDVYAVNGPEIKDDATIQHLNTPYRISGRVHILKTLTISPGCIFEFNTGGELTTTDFSGANHTGIIIAQGKSSYYKIFFKGVQSQPGSWVGISITSQGDNSFLNCEISDGGGAAGYQNPANVRGNVIVGRIGMGAKASIRWCTLSNSGGYGIAKYKNDLTPANSSVVSTTYAWGTPLTQHETNTFTTNALGNIGTY